MNANCYKTASGNLAFNSRDCLQYVEVLQQVTKPQAVIWPSTFDIDINVNDNSPMLQNRKR